MALTTSEYIMEVFACGLHMERNQSDMRQVIVTFDDPKTAAVWMICYDEAREWLVARAKARMADKADAREGSAG